MSPETRIGNQKVWWDEELDATPHAYCEYYIFYEQEQYSRVQETLTWKEREGWVVGEDVCPGFEGTKLVLFDGDKSVTGIHEQWLFLIPFDTNII